MATKILIVLAIWWSVKYFFAYKIKNKIKKGSSKASCFSSKRNKEKKKITLKSECSFSLATTKTIKRIINDFDVKKALSGEIPASLFKKCDFIFNTVKTCINTTLASGIFPESLKGVNISPIHKIDDPFDKKNYRPASILLLAWKVCERVI